MRQLWFPVTFLLLMVPLPEVSIAQLNFRLKMLVAECGVWLFSLTGAAVEHSGNSVFLEGGKNLVIANVCNGLRTLISLIGFAALYAYVCRLRGLWRLGLFAMSVPVAIVSNSVRIVCLIGVAHIFSVEAATGWFHDASGLMIYAIAFFLMFSMERLVLWVRKSFGIAAEGDGRRGQQVIISGQVSKLAVAVSSKRGWTAVILILLAAGVVWRLNESVRPVWNQQMVRSALPQTLVIDSRLWQGYDQILDEKTLTILETSDYLYRRYVSGQMNPVDICVIFSRDNRKGTHPPDLCAEGAGGNIVAKGDLILNGLPSREAVPCSEFVTNEGGKEFYYLYTYKYGHNYTRSFWRQQLGIFLNGLMNHNSAGALIRISTPIRTDVENARLKSIALLREAVPYLDRSLR